MRPLLRVTNKLIVLFLKTRKGWKETAWVFVMGFVFFGVSPAAAASPELDQLNTFLREYLTPAEITAARDSMAGEIQKLCDTVRQEIRNAGLADPQCSVTYDLSDQPGFERLDTTEIRLSLPQTGWSVHGNISAKVADICLIPSWWGKCLLRTKIIARFRVDVTNMRALGVITLAPSGNPDDPRPRITDSSVRFLYNVSVTEDHDWPIEIFQVFLRPFVDPASLLRNEISKQLDAFSGRMLARIPLASFTGLPGKAIGVGGPPAPDASDVSQEQLARYAASREALLEKEFQPDMNVLWESGDQVIWSGHLLAAEALRYAAARTNAERESAKAMARKLVVGMSDLLDLGSVLRDGVLAKTIWRETSGRWGSGPRLVPARETGGNPIFVNTIRGVTYAGESEPTTDQYLGFFLGSALAYEFIDDAALQSQIRSNINRVISNLERSQFKLFITNDENDFAAIRAAHPNKFYLTDALEGRQWLWSEAFLKDYQRLLAILAVHGYVNNDYRLLNAYGGIATFSWLPVWIDTFETHRSYFKFNLDHGYQFLLMRYDPDSSRRAYYKTALSYLRAAIGHHENAYFDLLTVLTRPGEPESTLSRALNGLRLFIKRTPVNNLTDPSVQKISYTPFSLEGASAETIARYPLPAHRRSSYNTRDFIWQRSPFTVTEGIGGGASAGIDFLLPYRMYVFKAKPALKVLENSNDAEAPPQAAVPPVAEPKPEPKPEPERGTPAFFRRIEDILKNLNVFKSEEHKDTSRLIPDVSPEKERQIFESITAPSSQITPDQDTGILRFLTAPQ